METGTRCFKRARSRDCRLDYFFFNKHQLPTELIVYFCFSCNAVNTGVPVAKFVNYNYLGCWKDQGNRLLKVKGNKEKKFVMNDLTPEKCRDKCRGHKYFGMESGKECFCGDYMDTNNDKKRLLGQCDHVCKGSTIKICHHYQYSCK